MSEEEVLLKVKTKHFSHASNVALVYFISLCSRLKCLDKKRMGCDDICANIHGLVHMPITLVIFLLFI